MFRIPPVRQFELVTVLFRILYIPLVPFLAAGFAAAAFLGGIVQQNREVRNRFAGTTRNSLRSLGEMLPGPGAARAGGPRAPELHFGVLKSSESSQ